MSRKKKTAGKTAKVKYFNADTEKFVTREEFIETISESIITALKRAATMENITVEKYLQNKELLCKFIASVIKTAEECFKTSDGNNIPIEIVEEVLNKAFGTLNFNTKIELKSVEFAA
jgi:hypothetical protein